MWCYWNHCLDFSGSPAKSLFQHSWNSMFLQHLFFIIGIHFHPCRQPWSVHINWIIWIKSKIIYDSMISRNTLGFYWYHKHEIFRERDASSLLSLTELATKVWNLHRSRMLYAGCCMLWWSSAKQHTIIDLVICLTIVSRSPTSILKLLATLKLCLVISCLWYIWSCAKQADNTSRGKLHSFWTRWNLMALN